MIVSKPHKKLKGILILFLVSTATLFLTFAPSIKIAHAYYNVEQPIVLNFLAVYGGTIQSGTIAECNDGVVYGDGSSQLFTLWGNCQFTIAMPNGYSGGGTYTTCTVTIYPPGCPIVYSSYWKNPPATVTLPITIATPTGGSAFTYTVSSSGVDYYGNACPTPSPTSATSGSSPTSFTVGNSCYVTATLPTPGANTEYAFAASSSTATVRACVYGTGGTCATFAPSDYYILLHTYTMATNTGTWGVTVSEPVIGTVAGATGTTGCSISVQSGGNSENCPGWFDYGTAACLVYVFNDATTGSWTAQGTYCFTDTTGGGTHSVTYNDIARAGEVYYLGSTGEGSCSGKCEKLDPNSGSADTTTSQSVASNNIGIDASGAFTGTYSSGTTFTITGFKTTSPNDVVLVLITSVNQPVSSVTDSASAISWQGSARRSYSTCTNMYDTEWYGIASSAISSSDTITIHYSTGPTYAAAEAFGVSGSNTAAPFDPDSHVPSYTADASSCAALATPSTTLVSTSNAHDLIVANYFEYSNAYYDSAGSGFTELSQAAENGAELWPEYKSVSVVQSNLACAYTGTMKYWLAFCDALVSATPNYKIEPDVGSTTAIGTPSNATPMGYAWETASSLGETTSSGAWAFRLTVKVSSTTGTPVGYIWIIWRSCATISLGTCTYLSKNFDNSTNVLASTTATAYTYTTASQASFSNIQYLVVEYWLHITNAPSLITVTETTVSTASFVNVPAFIVYEDVTMSPASSYSSSDSATITGCDSSISTIPLDNAHHLFIVDPSSTCTYGVTLSGVEGYTFSGNHTTTTHVNSASGTDTYTITVYRGYYNDYELIAVGASKFSTGMSWPVSIYFDGSVTTCTINSAAQSPINRKCWTDFYQIATIPQAASSPPAGLRWYASSSTACQIAAVNEESGGQTFPCNSYLQDSFTYSYSVTSGSLCGSPPCYNAPTLTAKQWGNSYAPTLTTTPTAYWPDNGSEWTVSDPLGGSTAADEWLTPQITSGTALTPTTTAFAYVQKFTPTLTASTGFSGTFGQSINPTQGTVLIAFSGTFNQGVKFFRSGASAFSGIFTWVKHLVSTIKIGGTGTATKIIQTAEANNDFVIFFLTLVSAMLLISYTLTNGRRPHK